VEPSGSIVHTRWSLIRYMGIGNKRSKWCSHWVAAFERLRHGVELGRFGMIASSDLLLSSVRGGRAYDNKVAICQLACCHCVLP